MGSETVLRDAEPLADVMARYQEQLVAHFERAKTVSLACCLSINESTAIEGSLCIGEMRSGTEELRSSRYVQEEERQMLNPERSDCFDETRQYNAMRCNAI